MKTKALLKFQNGSMGYADFEGDLIPVKFEVEGVEFILDKIQNDEAFVLFTEIPPFDIGLH